MFNVVSSLSFEIHQKKDLYLSDLMKVCEYRVHLFNYSYVIWKHLALLVLVDEDPTAVSPCLTIRLSPVMSELRGCVSVSQEQIWSHAGFLSLLLLSAISSLEESHRTCCPCSHSLYVSKWHRSSRAPREAISWWYNV